MRRSPALARLSRDHHHALVIAMALTRAGEGTARSSARLFADFIAEHEAQHFALEESLLLPALRRPSEAGLQPTVELVRTVGARLRAHVQMRP